MKSLVFLLISFNLFAQYDGPISDHFDGKRFFNERKMDKGLLDLIKWRLYGNSIPWPDSIPVIQQKVPKVLNSLAVTFINHATTLIQLDGINILTDPIYAKRTSPFSWIGPKRVRKPGVKFEHLPKIDVVIISHNHYDHLNIETLKKISIRDNPLFLIGLGNGKLLKSHKINNFKELDWNQLHQVNKVKINFLKAKHWCSRGLFDRQKTLWGSYLLEGPSGKVYFAGDTGYEKHFSDIGKRFGPIDISLLPIGAYLPRWFMKAQHLNPEDAVKAHLDLLSKKSMGIHFGTFKLSDEGVDQPEIDLTRARAKFQVPSRDFILPKFGQTIKIN